MTPAFYDLAGPDSGMPIVFLHGMRVTRHMWEPQMASLSDEFRVISMDLPGHGELCDVPFSITEAVARIAEVIRREAQGRALLVGISLGGYVAMEFAARWPEMLAGLVVASASVEPVGWHTVPYQLFAWSTDRLPQGLLDAITRAFFTLIYGKERAAPLIAHGLYMRGAAAGVRAIFGRRFCPKLAAYPGPVLLLNGALDLGFRLEEQMFLTAAQQGRLQVIPRAFHISNIDQPEAFSRAVRDFARGIGGSSETPAEPRFTPS